MKPLALAIGVILTVAIVWSAADNLAKSITGPTLTELAADRARAERITQEAELAAQWAPVTKGVTTLALYAALIGVLAYLGAMGAAHVHRTVYERHPDNRGLLPVLASDQETARAALAAFHVAHVEEARRPLVATVPHTLTYSPTHSFDYKAGAAAALLPGAEAAPLALPGLTDLGALAVRPSLDAIFLALGEGGERITVPARALCHVALVGATGGGKSNLLRLIVPQLQAVGARVVLADPHFAPFDAESGEDWRPIVNRLHLAPAVSADEIGALFDFLTDELGRRLELRRAGQRCGAPLFLALDELTVIADTVPAATENLGKLLREGRKVGLFTVGAAQSFLVKVIGGDSSAREAYRTTFYVGGDLRSAAALLDVPQGRIDEGAVGAGVAYLRSAATSPARLVRVPYASNAAIAALLGATSATTSATTSSSGTEEPYGSGLEVALEVGSGAPLPRRQEAAKWTAEEARILEALKAGKTPGEVAEEIAGGKGGRKYQEAARLVAEIIRRAIEI